MQPYEDLGKEYFKEEGTSKAKSNSDEVCLFKRKKKGQPNQTRVSSRGWRDMRPEKQPETINVEPVGLGKDFSFHSSCNGSQGDGGVVHSDLCFRKITLAAV